MHGQSGSLVKGGIALGMVEKAINACSDASANRTEVNQDSPLVKFPCMVYKKKASVHEEGQEIAKVTSHDFWQGSGKTDGSASVRRIEGRIAQNTIRRRAGWPRQEQH